MNKCNCGRRISRYANQCNACAKKTREEAIARARAIVATGRCPECGQPLRRNLALAGWWMCEGFGAEGFRAAGSTPCWFQTFTE